MTEEGIPPDAVQHEIVILVQCSYFLEKVPQLQL